MDGVEELRAAEWLLARRVEHVGCVLAGVRELPNVSRQTRICGVPLIRDMEAAPGAGDQVLLCHGATLSPLSHDLNAVQMMPQIVASAIRLKVKPRNALRRGFTSAGSFRLSEDGAGEVLGHGTGYRRTQCIPNFTKRASGKPF
jgi:hypothetical protein